jgi:zinc transport system substrate-binding protein
VRARIVLIFGVAAVLAAGCGGGEETGRRQVVAAFYPLAFAAQRLAPDTDVRNLTPAGAEPHDLELSPREVAEVGDADLVLYLGGGFMPAVENAAREHEAAVDLLADERLLEGGHEHGHEAGGDSDEGNEQAVDPHVWLDPRRFARLVRRIGAELGEPAAAAALTAELEALDAEYRVGLASCERRELVTSHAAFAYLAEAYDLEQIALTGLSPEAEPSPRQLEALVEEVEHEGATTVFYETLVSPDVARTVAREAGVETAVLNPLEGLTTEEIEAGADYFSVMRDNLAALRLALGCS